MTRLVIQFMLQKGWINDYYYYYYYKQVKKGNPPTGLSPDGQGPNRVGWLPERTRCETEGANQL